MKRRSFYNTAEKYILKKLKKSTCALRYVTLYNVNIEKEHFDIQLKKIGILTLYVFA
ncbi:hypothetical protein SAMN04487760_101399 [Lachnospiraceae bacterium G41]|nr:hypothetical protein SAMN04487760_101399 [Lachnospiraceae bacterium G41]